MTEINVKDCLVEAGIAQLMLKKVKQDRVTTVNPRDLTIKKCEFIAQKEKDGVVVRIVFPGEQGQITFGFKPVKNRLGTIILSNDHLEVLKEIATKL